MSTITNEFMGEMLKKSKPYTVVILKRGPKHSDPSSGPIVWEHARRNFEMHEAGKLAVVLPVRDESEVVGLGIFDASVEETKALMDGDPGVRAGVFVYDVHASRSFPGDGLR